MLSKYLHVIKVKPMKNLLKSILTIYIFGIVWSSSNAQCLTGEWMKPLPQGNTLQSLHFTDSNTGYACGDAGTLIKTYDGGHTWFNLYSGTNKCIKDIFFLDSNHGYAVGALGIILKTSNGGNTWTFLDGGVSAVNLYSVYFTDSLTGYIAGTNPGYCKMIKTTDGGLTWTDVTLSGVDKLFCVYFTSADTGYALGYKNSGSPAGSAFLKTTDAGNSWTVQYNNLSREFYSMHFEGSAIGYVAGGDQTGTNGYVNKTTNAGDTWTLKGTFNNITMKSVFFTSVDTGYVVGYKYGINNMYKTTNGGTTWNLLPSGVIDFYDIWFTDPDNGVAVGEGITLTTDAGSSWNEITQGGGEINRAIYFANELIGYTSGNDGVLYKTTDGGITWTPKPSSTIKHIYDIWFVNPDTGFFVGQDSMLCKTTDGGDNWSHISTGAIVDLNAIFFLNEDTGFVGGDDGIIMRTMDGGNNWTQVDSYNFYDINDIYFYDNNNGHAVGSGGQVRNTSNGGDSWSSNVSFGSVLLYGVFFTSATKGYAVGSTSNIYVTNDGGVFWSSTPSPTSSLLSIFFTDPDTGYACGGEQSWYVHSFTSAKSMIMTTDGGTTWQDVSLNFGVILRSLAYVGNNTIFAAGNNGSIVKYSDHIEMNPPIVSNINHCGQGPVLLTVAGGLYSNWYSSPTDTNLLCTSSAYYLQNITQSDTLYVSNTNSICESIRIPLVVSIHDLPSIDLGPDIISCDSEIVIINASGGYFSYEWSTGDTTQNIAVDSTGTGVGTIEIVLLVTDSFTCSNTDTINITFENCTWVYTKDMRELYLYPNPTEGRIQINAEDVSYIYVENITGEIIYEIKNSNWIDISNQPNGVYIITIIIKESKYTFKIIKN